MRKILNVIGSLNVGGAEINAVNVFRHLDRTKYKYDFLVFDEEPGEFEAEVKELGGGIIRLIEPKQDYLQFIKEFNQLLRENQYDVVHVNTLWNSGLLLTIAKKNKVPIRIAHSHSTDSSAKENTLYKAYKAVMRQLIRYSGNEYVACGIDAGEYLFGENHFKNKGQIIYNGVKLDKFKYNEDRRAQLRNELGILDNEFVIGHIGRLAPVKNHSFMIDILKQLSTNHPNIKLVLTGDGPDYQKILKQVQDEELEDKVLLLGQRNDIDAIVQAYDLMIFPSFFEGFPLTLIEAQASGLPVLISENVTDEASVIKESTRLPLDDQQLWIELIEQYQENIVARDNVDITRIEEDFDIKQLAKKWEKIYDRKI